MRNDATCYDAFFLTFLFELVMILGKPQSLHFLVLEKRNSLLLEIFSIQEKDRFVCLIFIEKL